MSVSVEQGPFAGVTPEVSVPKAEELFAEHVEYVRKNGDAFDQRPSLTVRYAGRVAMISTGVIAAILSQENTTLPILGVATAAGVVTGVAQVGIGMMTDRRNKGRARQAFGGKGSMAHNDAFYELYAIKGRPGRRDEVAMRWYGPHENKDERSGRDELLHVAELAKKYDVSTLMVGDGLAAECGDGELPGKEYTMARWLWKKKRLPTKDATEQDNIHEAPPDRWLKYASEKPAYDIVEGEVHLRPELAGVQAVAEYAGLRAPTSSAISREGKRIPLKPLGAVQPYTAQQAIALEVERNVASKPRLNKRLHKLAAVTGAVVAFLSVNAGQGVADEALEKRNQEASRQIANENHVRPDLADVDPKAVRQRVDSWHGINGPWRTWHDIRKTAHESMRDWTADKSEALGRTSALGDGTLNTEKEKRTTPLWRISAHGFSDDMLSGDWAQSTSNSLLAVKQPDGMPVISWVANANMYNGNGGIHVATYEKAVPHPTQDSQWIKAEADGSEVILPTIGASAKDFVDGRITLMNIPVKDGMILIAANQDGKALPWIFKPDGTTALLFEGKDPYHDGTIAYYMAPDVFSSQQPKATKAVSVISSSDGSRMDRNTHRVKAAIDKYAPQLHGMTTAQKTNYLYNNLGYKTPPFSKNTLRQVDSLDDPVRDVLEAKRADCGFAATTLILANEVDKGRVLNGLLGYKNGKDPHVLDVSEAHIRAVDTDGTIYEPTPWRAAEPLTAKKSKQEQKDTPLPVMPINVLAGLSIAAAGAYVGRRKIYRAVTHRAAAWETRVEAERQAAQSELTALSHVYLRRAQAALDVATYAPQDVPLRRSDISSAVIDSTTSKEQALHALTDPHAQAATVLNRLRKETLMTSELRHTLTLARQASRPAPRSNKKSSPKLRATTQTTRQPIVSLEDEQMWRRPTS